MKEQSWGKWVYFYVPTVLILLFLANLIGQQEELLLKVTVFGFIPVATLVFGLLSARWCAAIMAGVIFQLVNMFFMGMIASEPDLFDLILTISALAVPALAGLFSAAIRRFLIRKKSDNISSDALYCSKPIERKWGVVSSVFISVLVICIFIANAYIIRAGSSETMMIGFAFVGVPVIAIVFGLFSARLLASAIAGDIFQILFILSSIIMDEGMDSESIILFSIAYLGSVILGIIGYLIRRPFLKKKVIEQDQGCCTLNSSQIL